MTVLNIRRFIVPLLWLVVIVFLIAVALNSWSYFSTRTQARVDRSNALQVIKPAEEANYSTVTQPDFFVEYRLERDRLRSEQSEVLQEIIRTAESEEVRRKAQDAELKLVAAKLEEAEMENLIKARGFSDALVVMTDNDVSAVVKTKNLKQEDVLQVADIIGRIAGVKPEDITISAKP